MFETAYLKTCNFPTFLFKWEPSFGGCRIGNAWLRVQTAISAHICGLQIFDMFSGLRVKLRNSDGSERQRAVTVAGKQFGNNFWASQLGQTCMASGVMRVL